MKKYRIKEYIKADGSSFFEIQERFLFIWHTLEVGVNCFSTKEEAERKIDLMHSRTIIKTKIHE